MKTVYTLLKIVLLLLFLVLAVSNTDSVVFHYLPGQPVSLPLIVLLLAVFVIGAAIGVLAMFRRLLTLRNEAARLQAALDKLDKQQRTAEAPAVAPVSPAAEQQQA